MSYNNMVAGGKGRSYVIVGNGIAGVTAAETLRAEDSAASITIIAADTSPVYYRPALKDFLGGRVPAEKLWARPHSFYQDMRVQYIADQVMTVDGWQHLIWLASGRQVNYDRLLLANGALANTLTCPGMQLAGVTTLRSVAEYQTVLGYLGNVRRVVVVGSGTLALETVEMLRQRGLHITHLLRHQTLWSEVLDATASDLVLQQEEHDGVDVRLEQEIAEIMGKDGRVSGVITRQGQHFPCELVLIAIGIQPGIDFILRSGITCGRGVQVDASMRTNMPDIYAAGDVVETYNPLTGRARPLGQWYPAIQQARAAAYSMLDLLDTSNTAGANVNYLNATFLYGLDFASVGLTSISGYPFQALVAEPQPRRYQKALLHNGIPVGWLSLGDRTPALAFKRAIDHRINLLPVGSALFEQHFDLDTWLDEQGVPPPMLDVSKVGEGQYNQRVNAKRTHFEIDMCIGCDRCMLACPVPLSSSITIADLNAATISQAGVLAPQIASFTEACVMCGSCVPVCPVGNHRDLLMLSLKQRFGPSWDGPVDIARVQGSLPAGLSLPSLFAALRTQPLFSQGVPDAYLLHLIMESNVQPCEAGQVLFGEGEFGRDIFFILDGQIELSATGAGGAALPLALHGRGEYVGDYGMRGHQHYATATVRSPNGALLLVVREQTMQRLIELVPAMRSSVERNAQSLEAILKRLSLFAGLPDDAMRWLAQQTRTRSYERDERLFAEEERNQGSVEIREALHIVLEGFVKVSRRTEMGTGRAKGDERVIAYRRHGDFFAGGLDMLGDQQAVTATAITRVRVAEVPRQVLSQILSAFPAVAQRFQAGLQQYREAVDAAQTAVFAAIDPRQIAAGMPASSPRSDAEARQGLHALVSEGVVEGTDVLVIDLDRCIHCGECEEACARRHGHSRMNRKGMVVGNMSIATACRQCQDPVCMLCSRGGIARMPGGEVYITESCIGCGICAERCPYDNISIVPLAESRAGRTGAETLSTWQRFNSLLKHGFGKEAGRKTLPVLAAGTLLRPLDVESRDGYTEMLKKVAIKCDLCAGYENQACVQACPTGAAFRVNPVRFFGSTEDILRQRAR